MSIFRAVPRRGSTSRGHGSSLLLCVHEVDLASDHMFEASSLAGQDHFDLEFSLPGKPFIAHHSFDGLLRGNAYLP